MAPIKRYVDEQEKKGQYLFTGSQNLSTIKNAAESMAGRVGVLQLDVLSFDEIAQKPKNFLEIYMHSPDSKQKIMPGIVLYAGNECYPVAEDVFALSWDGMFQ